MFNRRALSLVKRNYLLLFSVVMSGVMWMCRSPGSFCRAGIKAQCIDTGAVAPTPYLGGFTARCLLSAGACGAAALAAACLWGHINTHRVSQHVRCRPGYGMHKALPKLVGRQAFGIDKKQ
jgi:hypothetical protein